MSTSRNRAGGSAQEAAGAANGQSEAAVQADALGDASDEAIPALSGAERLKRAERIVQNHTLVSAGTGLIPAPGVDILANLAVQLTMLQRLSKLYGVPYSENLGKAAVISLASSIGGPGAALTIAASMVKIVPFFGTLAGGLSVPATFGAFTFAVGKVFTQHFESGGTFLDFRASAYRDYFREMFGRGQAVVQEEKAAQDPEKTASDKTAPSPGTA